MSDPTTPAPDPVEDRLRRTFAARAEHMAPGDDPGAHGARRLLAGPTAGAGPTPPGDQRPGRFLLAAAIVVIVGAALAVIGVVRLDGDDDGEAGDPAGRGRPEADAALAVDLVAAPRDLVVALQDERNLASLDLLGQDDLVALPVGDADEARRRTDEAIATLESLVAAEPAAAAYQGALDDLAGLADLRGDIDAYEGPRGIQVVDTANEVFHRYARLAGGLVERQDEVALAIDDPDLRAGVQLGAAGLRQQERTAVLVRMALQVAIEPGSETVADLSRLHAEVQQGMDDLRTAAAGTPYEPATTAVLGEIEASGLLDVVASALEAGPVDIAALLDATELPAGEGWPAFHDRVVATLAAEG